MDIKDGLKVMVTTLMKKTLKRWSSGGNSEKKSFICMYYVVLVK